MSRLLWNKSKAGKPTTSLRNMCQCLVTITGKKCFLIFRGYLLCFCLCPLPLVLALGPTEKSLIITSLQPFYRCLYTLMRSPRAIPSLFWWDSTLSAFAHRRSATVPSSPLWLFAGPRPLCPCFSCTYFYAIHNSCTATVPSFKHLFST